MIFLILKAILYIIIFLLAAVLAVVLIVLLNPIRFQVKGDFKEEKAGSLKVRWLFGLVSFSGALKKEGLNIELKYPLKDFLARSKAKKAAKASKSEKAEKSEVKPKEKAPKPSEKSPPKDEGGKAAEPVKTESAEAPEKTSENASQKEAEKEKPKNETKKDVSEKKPKKQKKAKEEKPKGGGFGGFLNKLKEIKAVENKGDIISSLAKNIKYIAKHTKLDIEKLDILFGFDDPSLTGKLLGFLYACGLGLIGGADIRGSFTKAAFEAEINIKGRTRLVYIAIAAIRLLLNKNISNLLSKEG